MDRRSFIDSVFSLVVGAAGGKHLLPLAHPSLVTVSKVNPHYFALSNGQPFVVNGLNLAWAHGLDDMAGYLKKLSAAGGNFARVWLCHWPLEVENRYGIYDEENARNIDFLLTSASDCKIRIKFCLENTRQIVSDPHAPFNRPQYHIDNGGPFRNIDEYINSPQGRSIYLNRLTFLSNRYREHPAIFGWELWNEMNGIQCGGLDEWNGYMLPRVQELFPQHLVMQSLGSFDSPGRRREYRNITSLPSNAIGQIHRYLDEGAQLDVCKGPLDLLAADAIEELRSYQLHKPLLLAETGAVRPSHAGPSDLYAMDKAGMMLHDMLFAPFFSGAAGSGNPWHWEEYIDKYGLWYHFGRFGAIVNGINVIAEEFQPEKDRQDRLRLYVLRGTNTTLIWCRDSRNDWRSELQAGIAPETVSGAVVNCSGWVSPQQIKEVTCYDPWVGQWRNIEPAGRLLLPDFRRSVVIKINKN
ncbi:MAG TPA: hypothetical protein VK518_05130 [Puia sp.]|nr:hypothetical protein [Puia sp.]